MLASYETKIKKHLCKVTDPAPPPKRLLFIVKCVTPWLVKVYWSLTEKLFIHHSWVFTIHILRVKQYTHNIRLVKTKPKSVDQLWKLNLRLTTYYIFLKGDMRDAKFWEKSQFSNFFVIFISPTSSILLIRLVNILFQSFLVIPRFLAALQLTAVQGSARPCFDFWDQVWDWNF